ncbi:hypothetical protein D1007_56450 [Hordeum vulgare]|nr:hypothetical protein D1007_56450 [Hordeum vulgare]
MNVASHPGPLPRRIVQPPHWDASTKPTNLPPKRLKIATQVKAEMLPLPMKPPPRRRLAVWAAVPTSTKPDVGENLTQQGQASSPKQRHQEGNKEDVVIACSGNNPELRFTPGEPKPLVQEEEFYDDASKQGNDARRRRVYGTNKVMPRLWSGIHPTQHKRPADLDHNVGAVPAATNSLHRRPPS